MGKTNQRPRKTWQKSRGTDLELPSGNIALCKRMRPEQFLTSGLLPDSMSAMVMEAIRERKGLPPEDAAAMAADPERLAEMVDFMDAVLIQTVIEPKIKPVPRGPEGEDLRTGEEEDLYPDDVDLTDKVFIFQWALSGSSDLERFREEMARNMEDLSAG